MQSTLGAIADFFSHGRLGFRQLAWHEITKTHAEALRDYLSKKTNRNPASVNRHLSALRSVLARAWEEEFLDAETYQRVRSVRNLSGRREIRGRMIPDEVLAKIFQNCREDPKRATGARDAALIAVMANAVRRSEAVTAKMERFNQEDKTIWVLGKGNKEREVTLDDAAFEAVSWWASFRGYKPGPLFLPVDRWGHIHFQERPMTDQVAAQVLRRRYLAADVRPIAPHDLRRTWTTNALRVMGIIQVAKKTGHKNLDTVKLYDQSERDEQLELANRVKTPFSGK